MSKQVDERVVSMRFDNKQFEKNVETTISTLDKLKQKLNLKGASKGLEELDSASKKVDMSPIGKSVDAIKVKFSAMEVMAVTALANITNSAVNMGKRMVSALTIDPIKTGFQEYETQINSVQTILANTESKGSTLQDVNNALAELNTYADKTIYNFTEMTRNIGTFTAAGVDLKTSVSAIKGIANLAAVSGSNSQQASTAMYQLSQALSSGTVKLMDWNSVVNAGMGGQVFQDSLKETAKVHGVNVDAMIKKQGSFRETLQDGWLTAEILTETLSKFTGDLSAEQLKSMGYTDEQIEKIVKMGKTANDAATKVKTFTQLFDTLKEAAQSGWTKSWELLIGDFGEAKELLTDISDLVGGVIGASSDKRNDILMSGLSTGWKQLLNEGIHDAAGFEEMVSTVAKEHGVDIASMINDETSFQDVLKKSLKEGTLTSDVLGESISKFTEKVKGMSKEEMEAAGYTGEHIKKLTELNNKVKDGSLSMEEFSNLIVRPSGRELLIESLWNSIKAIQSVITPIKQAFEEVFEPFTGGDLYSIIESIRDFTAKLTLNEEQSAKLKSTFKGLFSIINGGVQIIKSIISGFGKLIGAVLPVGDGLLSVTGSLGDFLYGIGNAMSEINVLDSIFQGAANILKSISTGISNVLSSLAGGIDKCGGIIGILQKITSVIGDLFDKITVATPGHSIFDTLFDLVNGGIMTAIGLWIAKIIKTLSNFSESADGFLESITDILGGLGDALNAFTGSLKADMLKKIAISIGILAASLLVISLIDPGKLTLALTSMTALFGELMLSLTVLNKILDKGSFKGVTKVTFAMISLASSILILSAALKIMSTMSWSEMGVGLISLGVGLGALVGAVNLLPEKKLNDAAKAIRKMSTSLVILAVAIKIMSTMSWSEMGVGLISLGVGLTALVIAVNKLPSDAPKKAANMIVLATSMVILASAIKILSSMSWQELALGLGAMVVGLSALVIAINKLPMDAPKKAANMIVLATSMVILASAIKILGGMTWQELVSGILAMGVSLGILVGALHLLPKDVAGKAASILILSTSMVILAAAIKILGSMPIDSLIKGIASIAAVLVVLGVAAYVLSPVAGVMLAIGGAIALLGVGCIAAGAGLILISAGITALATAIVASAGIILAGANEIVGVFTTIILSIVTALVTCIPAITNGLLQLLFSVLTGLVQYTPQLVNLLFDFVIGLINALAERLPDLIQAGVNLLMAFFQGVLDALGSIDTTVLIQGLAAVGLFAGLIIALSAIAPFIPGAMLAVLGMGALVVELGLVLAAIGALAQIPGLKWLIGEGGDLLQQIGTAIGQFFGGIIAGIAEGALSTLPQIGLYLSQFMVNATPFIAGVKLIDADALESVKTLAEIILLLTGAGILEGLTSWLTGGNSIVDFGRQLAEFGPYISEFATSVAGINSEAVTAAANAGKLLAEMADTIPSDWGNDNLTDFGGQFKDFGDDIVDFSNTISGNIDIGGIENAVKGSKLLAEVAKAIPSDWGNNNLKNFGTQVVSLGKSVVSFSDTVGNVTNIDQAVNAVKTLITSLSDIASSDASSITAFGDTLKNIATNAIQGFIDTFSSDATKANTAISGFMTSVSTTISSYAAKDSSIYTSFYNVGEYAVDGFVKGITDNKASVTAAGTAIGNYALQAAKKAIDSNSPSKKFMELGSFTIAGFAKGITDNLGDIKKSAVTLGDTMLKATQDNLDINSPSLVFDKKVGRYIVQGIAEGIKKDMSAEEAAEKKAQNIVEAFRKGLEKISVKSDIASENYKQWELTEGADLTDLEKDRVKLKYDKAELPRLEESQKLYHDKWQLMKDQFAKGAVDQQAVDDALLEYEKAITATYSKVKDIHDLEKSIPLDTFTEDYEKYRSKTDKKYENTDALIKDLDDAKEIRDMMREEWLATATYLSEEEKDARIIKDLYKDLDTLDMKKSLLQNKHTQLLDESVVLKNKYNEALATYGEEHEITKKIAEDIKANKEDVTDVFKEMWAIDVEEANVHNNIRDTEAKKTERLLNAIDQRMSTRDKQEKLWELTDGRKASDEVKDMMKTAYARDDLRDLTEKLHTKTDIYMDKLAKYGADHEETKKAYDDMIQASVDVAQTEADIAQIAEDAAKRELEALKKQHDLASQNADIRYQIWEKTTGRKATGAEKDIAKLGVLSEQMMAQTELLQLSRQEWEKAKNEYGKSSVEAQEAYTAYLQKQLDIANLQDEITTISEKSAARQKLAQSEYADYVEKYEKYYLKNGMTREDLERDAKLVSGYDPNNKVKDMLNSTSTALTNYASSSQYQQTVDGFKNIGTSYVTAVSDGMDENTSSITDYVTSMAKSMIDALNGQYTLFKEAGTNMVIGIINGIEENAHNAVLEVIALAEAMNAAFEATLDINSPSKVYASYGMYMVKGLVNGLASNAYLSDRAATDLGNSAIENLKNSIKQITEMTESGIDAQPTIRPVLDLSDIHKGTAQLDSMFSRTQAMRINADMNNQKVNEIQNGVKDTPSAGNTYNYTQNNYSPKALSRAEIYRQTKNQFAAMKGATT